MDLAIKMPICLSKRVVNLCQHLGVKRIMYEVLHE